MPEQKKPQTTKTQAKPAAGMKKPVHESTSKKQPTKSGRGC